MWYCSWRTLMIHEPIWIVCCDRMLCGSFAIWYTPNNNVAIRMIMILLPSTRRWRQIMMTNTLADESSFRFSINEKRSGVCCCNTPFNKINGPSPVCHSHLHMTQNRTLMEEVCYRLCRNQYHRYLYCIQMLKHSYDCITIDWTHEWTKCRRFAMAIGEIRMRE